MFTGLILSGHTVAGLEIMACSYIHGIQLNPFDS